MPQNERGRLAWSDLAPTPGPRADILREGDHVIKVVVASSPPESIDRDNLELEAVVSGDEVKDSYGDLVRPSGASFERWVKNPVVMWAHDYRIPPIATGRWIKVQKPNLVSRMRFWSGDGEWGDFAREIFEMYAASPPNMRAFSIGFMPTKWSAMYDTTEEGAKVFIGYDFEEWDLWEYSCVPIPAYPNALARSAHADLTRMPLPATLIDKFASLGDRPASAERSVALAETKRALSLMRVGLAARALRRRIGAR